CRRHDRLRTLARVEVRDYREHAALIVLPCRQAQLPEDGPDVLLDGRRGDPQRVRNTRVRAALRHQGKHLPLARREDVKRVPRAACGNELLNERWIDDRGTLDDPLERVDKVLDVRDAALEQVTAPLAAREQRGRAVHLHVRGECDDGGIWKLLADRLCSLEPLGRVRGRHANVDDHEVGPKLAHHLDQLGRVPALTLHLETGALEQAGETLAHENLVVRQHDPGRARAHGNNYGLT